MDASYFASPYTDRDEWRDAPVRHRYVHGGFEGTETRFSLYFPPDDEYAGRFLHNIEGGGGGSDEAGWSPDDPLGSDVAHALAAGAYFVVSNQGHDGPDATHLDRWIHHYGANVAVAEHARTVAASVYGAAPHHGYIYGGSGGAGRTIACLEHAPAGLYDGAVVYILPHVAQQVLCAYVAEAARVLGDALPPSWTRRLRVGAAIPSPRSRRSNAPRWRRCTSSGSRAVRRTRSIPSRSR